VSQFSAFGLPVVVAMLMASCRSYEFTGDGKLVDHGYWSGSPRFEASLSPPVPLDLQHERTYRFRGMPRDVSYLQFLVSPVATELDVRASSASLAVELRGESGSLVCSFSASMATVKVAAVGGGDGRAATARSVWDPSCRDLKFDDRAWYTLIVRVTVQSDNPKGSLTLVPHFSGGGWDSP